MRTKRKPPTPGFPLRHLARPSQGPGQVLGTQGGQFPIGITSLTTGVPDTAGDGQRQPVTAGARQPQEDKGSPQPQGRRRHSRKTSGRHTELPKCRSDSSTGIQALPPTLRTNLVAAVLPHHVPQRSLRPGTARLSHAPCSHSRPRAALAWEGWQQGELQGPRAPQGLLARLWEGSLSWLPPSPRVVRTGS